MIGRATGRALTARQDEVLAFMRQFFDANDQLPPLGLTAKHFGVRTNAIADIATALRRKGWIEPNAVGKFRFTRERAAALADVPWPRRADTSPQAAP